MVTRTISRIIHEECERCGHRNVRATITREVGAGAELLVKCPACGHEEWSEIGEDAVHLLATLGESA